jgi:hypothetical protein
VIKIIGQITTMSSIESEVGAYEKERLDKLSQQPNTTVFKTEYDSIHDPWEAKRLRGVAERVAKRVTEFGEDVSDFKVRKTCLEDEDVLNFQRQHPKLFWLLTDREMVKDTRFRQALGAMFNVKEKVENGEIEEGRDADALATSSIVSALQQSN